jgi:hypothetical protein
MMRLLTTSLLAASLACFVACDKGPKKGEPTPGKDKPNASAAAAPSAKAAPAKRPADGKTYGKGVTQPASVSISAIMDNPQAYEGKTVRVEGLVTDVCPKRGCWFEMAGDKPGKKMKFKVDDGVMVFPMTTKGKYAVAQGVVQVSKLSLEQTRKHAVYVASEKGEKLDPKTITEPRTVVRIMGSGAVIRDKK